MAGTGVVSGTGLRFRGLWTLGKKGSNGPRFWGGPGVQWESGSGTFWELLRLGLTEFLYL